MEILKLKVVASSRNQEKLVFDLYDNVCLLTHAWIRPCMEKHMTFIIHQGSSNEQRAISRDIFMTINSYNLHPEGQYPPSALYTFGQVSTGMPATFLAQLMYSSYIWGTFPVFLYHFGNLPFWIGIIKRDSDGLCNRITERIQQSLNMNEIQTDQLRKNGIEMLISISLHIISPPFYAFV